jgi:integrase
MRFLSPDGIQHLADTIDAHHRTLILLAAYTGLRWGEAVGLHLDDLNLLGRTLTVSRTLSEVRGQLTLTDPKTRAARRQTALPGPVADLLAEHLAAYPARNGHVFTTPNGQPLRRTNFRRRVWQPAVAASVGEPCRFHDLRHSHAALLIAQGTHPKAIQARLGHASIRTTLDIYGHLFEGLDEAAADRLEEAYRQADVVRMWSPDPAPVVSLPQR